MPEHRSVMVKEVLEFLSPSANRDFLDATVGGGGHAVEILKLTGPKGRLIGIDWDDEALEAAAERLKPFGGRVTLLRENFANLKEALAMAGWAGVEAFREISEVDGVLFDLGVSSHQLGQADRGFSFSLTGPLDMRMDRRQSLTAMEVVNRYPVKELEEVIRRFGQERFAKRIARAIGAARERREIATTRELSGLVAAAYHRGRWPEKIHPATRTFQAIRIEVNRELENLENGLRAGAQLLRAGGRMVCISFHSLEDGTVKREFRALERGCICPPTQPVCTCGRASLVKVLTRKPVFPTEAEVAENPRARSAKLRAVEKKVGAR